MSDPITSGDLLGKVAKYGVGSVIALYLTFFLAHVVSTKLDDIALNQTKQTEILSDLNQTMKDVRYSIKAQAGISFRTEP